MTLAKVYSCIFSLFLLVACGVQRPENIKPATKSAPMSVAAVQKEEPSPSEWLSPWIGILGVVIGAGVTEAFRRRQRIEQFAGLVFAKRFEVYERLWSLLGAGHTMVGEIFDASEMPLEDRKAIVGAATMVVASHMDEHSLYFDDEVVVQCCTLFMGVEEFADLDGDEKKGAVDKYNKNWRYARQLIRECSGMSKINSSFGSVYKPKMDSHVIKYFRTERAKKMKSDRKSS